MRAIAAMSANRGIGNNNKLPWYIKEDLQYFKTVTKGQNILVGRKTFESIGPLPDRQIFVLSSSFPNAEFEKKSKILEEKVRSCKIIPVSNWATEVPSDVWVCGGANVYQQLLEYCTDFHLTFVDKIVKADTFMPWFEDDFQLITSERHHTDRGCAYEFRRYLNKLIYEQ